MNLHFAKQKYQANLSKEDRKWLFLTRFQIIKKTDKSFDECAGVMDRIIQWVGLSPSEVLIILLRWNFVRSALYPYVEWLKFPQLWKFWKIDPQYFVWKIQLLHNFCPFSQVFPIFYWQIQIFKKSSGHTTYNQEIRNIICVSTAPLHTLLDPTRQA